MQESAISSTRAEESARKINEAHEELKLAKESMSAESSSIQQKFEDTLATLEESEQRVFELSDILAKNESEMKKVRAEKTQLEV